MSVRIWWPTVFSALISISCDAFSIDASIKIKQKYPNVLLTDDYGILSENDLVTPPGYGKPEPFSVKDGVDYNYWQCFPRERVTLNLEDKGYPPTGSKQDGNYGELTIKVWLNGGVSHEYYRRRLVDVDSTAEVFNAWRKLMRNEKYVCLAGLFSSKEEIISDNKKRDNYYWVFEKIKTKKGCDSYFAGQCDLTYKKFLQERGRMK